ncbi:heavy metal resistance protein CzcA [Myxococcus xanthus]|uniref:Heavy metal resistance protein CzcA n=1 Tax=Myxococcus xanthus TaxID=34 RepID=A0AAE6G769_MYXXA|nr:CusA/CzcA family heavy metal efflux RND transporter [Myxococcus xanthus]QDE72161.1 heavy metal resistance protein CzcA [Myxococcus xanthus]QDE79443.1 heavy metal resistance protein CzcA [Myxococcus xanthus]
MLRALIAFCVRSRLPVLLLTLGIGLFGVKAYLETPVEAFPDVTNLQVNVIAQMPGLAPEEIERQVTVPLERVLNGTPGMVQMRSESLFGLSLLFLTFDDGVDPFKARTIVGERMSNADMPDGADVRLAPEATPLGKIYQFRVLSDRHTLTETRSEMEWNIARHLRQVPGVADVLSLGGFLKEFHVQVDPSRLLAHELTLADVTEALSRSNRNVGGGFLRQGDQELLIRGVGYLRGARDVQSIVLKSEDGTPVTVGDVARVVASHTPRRGSVSHNLDMDVTEGVVLLRRGENPSTVLEGVHAKVEELNSRVLPKGMRIEAFYDRNVLVGHTLSTVHHNLLHGALLVVAVAWLFLRSLRCSLIVASVIPLALLTAFIGLKMVGLPANLISMGAIDFGILVDGAVVLVENVLHEAGVQRPRRRKEMLGLILRSALDVARPTFFAMAIIIAALIPVFTLERVEGRIFRPLSLTYSFALVGALVFALTVVPALCALLLRPQDAEVKEPKLLTTLREGYGRAVTWLMPRKTLVFASMAALVLVTGVVGSRVGSEFLPELDEGDINIFVEMPASISLGKGADILLEVRRRLLDFPEVKEVLVEQGRPEDGTDNEAVNMGKTFVRFTPEETWRKGWDKERLVREMRASLLEIPGVSFNFSQPIKDSVEEAISGVRGKVVLKIFGTDLAAMRGTLEQAVASLQKVEGVVDLGLYRDSSVPQLQVVLDRPALARAGIDVSTAQDLVETALGGRVVTELWEQERPVPVRVILPGTERDDEARIGGILVPTASGGHVPLREVARLEKALGRASINREANSRTLALKFNVEGRDMGSTIQEAMATVEREVTVPEGTFLKWGGEFENQERALGRLAVIVPISFLVVFALLYAALGSMRSASAVLAGAPFAMCGGVLALAVTGIPLSVSAAVGFITLLGQVCLASLLVVSAVDDRRKAGESLEAALPAGASSRFRAVLMTALLAMLGLMPAALSSGAGSETQRPFAVVIIGGLVTAVLVSLFALPAFYSVIVGKHAASTGSGDDEDDEDLDAGVEHIGPKGHGPEQGTAGVAA